MNIPSLLTILSQILSKIVESSNPTIEAQPPPVPVIESSHPTIDSMIIEYDDSTIENQTVTSPTPSIQTILSHILPLIIQDEQPKISQLSQRNVSSITQSDIPSSSNNEYFDIP